MIFARYNGVENKNFTYGKVYPAKPEMDSDSFSFNFIEVRNDVGENVRIDARKETTSTGDVVTSDFEFLEEVYAVVAKPFDDFKIGQVLVVDDVGEFSGKKSQGGMWNRLAYNIKGSGYRSSEWLVLLDRTNVYPGIVILDETTGRWEQVHTVDESLWVIVDGQKNRRPPEEFVFAVDKDGDIMVGPLFECVDETGQPGLSNGTRYYVLREEDTVTGRLFWVVNDAGIEDRYLASRFKI